MTSPRPRYQVTETARGFQLKDTRTGIAYGRYYVRAGWAIRAAVRLNNLGV